MQSVRTQSKTARPRPGLGPDDTVSGSVLAVDPPIVLLKPRPRPFGPAPYLASRHPETPFVFLRQLTWSYESWPSVVGLAVRHRRFRRKYPRARLVILTNTATLADRLAALRVDAFFASSNMFLDETLFRPLPGRPKRRDAIYNAQLNPYKRHALARAIPTCDYITYLPTFQDEAARRRRIENFLKALPPGQSVLNERVGENFRMMSEPEVNVALNESHVGLCLSRVEGQMYASVEYLLAGIPVVTTPNRGGRDVYLDPDTSIVARDDPRAIRDAVAAMKARAVPAEVVRAKVMRLIERDRARFNGFVEDLTGGVRAGTDPRFSFPYVHKLVTPMPLSRMEAEALASPTGGSAVGAPSTDQGIAGVEPALEFPVSLADLAIDGLLRLEAVSLELLRALKLLG